jgi:catalase
MPDGLGWQEKFLGGSSSAEGKLLEQFERDINRLQESVAARADGVVRRGFHAKTIAGIQSATFTVEPTIPQPLCVGFFQPGKAYSAAVRFSNSISEIEPDRSRQGRGIAVRISSDGLFHDLLLSDSPASHARDAIQFMAVASALAKPSRAKVLIELVRRVGLFEAIRMLIVLFKTSGNISSVATQTYWSRTPFAFGGSAARLVLKPVAISDGIKHHPDNLHEELRTRLLAHDVEFVLFAQLYVDESRTPIEDGSIVWQETMAPPIPIGRLTIPAQDLNLAPAADFDRQVEQLDFNPWNVHGDIRPLGSLNRARRVVYQSSATLRHRA